jgi:hypothetical protein
VLGASLPHAVVSHALAYVLAGHIARHRLLAGDVVVLARKVPVWRPAI